MIKKFKGYAVFAFILLTVTISYSQNHPVFEEVQAIQASGIRPVSIPLFHTLSLRETPINLKEKVKEATLMEVNRPVLNKIIQQQPDLIQLSIPGIGDADGYTLKLLRQDPFTDQFKMVDGEERIIPYRPGVYYRGYIVGDPKSIAAISFFEGDIIGVTSPAEGNQVIGKWGELNKGSTYILYNESDLQIPTPPVCAVDETMESAVEASTTSSINPNSYQGKECKTVAVYLEADYNVFTKKGRSIQSVSNYITGIYNIVSTLYANEGINTKINKLKVWDKRDPYNYSTSNAALNTFGQRIGNNFDGDLAHLLSLSSNNLGGLAWVDVLCGNGHRHAFSNIGLGYTDFPTYSWTTEVVTHEMGHNLGSPHTQRCFWGPQHNQALDNCYATEGGCPRGPAPRNGGTIMSYCHLTRYGINFRNGFGKEPGDLIRNRVRGAGCLGDAFAATISPNGPINVYYGDSAVLSASPTGNKYTYQWYANGLPIPGATQPTLVVKEFGNYNVEVTTTCSVLSKPIKVTNSEFIASINFPPKSGGRDSVQHSIRDSLKGGKAKDYLVEFKPAVFQNIPTGTHQWFMQMRIRLKGGFPIYLNQLKMTITGPPGSDISLKDFYPADGVDIFVEADTFKYNLGKTDPTGQWNIHIANENGALVGPLTFDVDFAFVWILKSKPSDKNERSCTSGEVTLDAGIRADTYQWSTGATTRSIKVAKTGYYAVTATKGALVATDDIEVIKDPTTFDIQQTICEGDSLVFGNRVLKKTGTYQAQFTSSIGCDSAVTLHLNVQPDYYREEEIMLCYGDVFQDKKYYSSQTITQMLQTQVGCDSVRVYHLKVSPEIIANIRVDTGCANIGSNLEINSNNPADTYRWTNGKTTQKIKNVKDKTIGVRVTNSDGCALDLNTSVPHYPAIIMNAVTTPIACNGDMNGQIELKINGGSGQKHLLWKDGSNRLIRKNLAAGQYSVTVTDEKQCQEQRNFTLKDPPALTANSTVRGTANGTSKGAIILDVQGGTPPYKYHWSTGSTDKDLVDVPKGKYSVTITDAHQCQLVKTEQITENTAVKDINHSDIYAKVYPNPAHKQLWIKGKLPYPQQLSLTVFDASGHTFHQGSYSCGKSFHLPVLTKDWPNGLYIIRITNSKNTLLLESLIDH